MTEGRPDWHKYVDTNIIGQDLDRLLAIGAAGPLREAWYDDDFGLGGKYIIQVDGPGVVMGGFIKHTDGSGLDHKDCTIELNIDSTTTMTYTFENRMEHCHYKNDSALLRLVKYDEIEQVFIVGISPGHMFESFCWLYAVEYNAQGNWEAVLFYMDL